MTENVNSYVTSKGYITTNRSADDLKVTGDLNCWNLKPNGTSIYIQGSVGINMNKHTALNTFSAFTVHGGDVTGTNSVAPMAMMLPIVKGTGLAGITGAKGMVLYDLDDNKVKCHNGTGWQNAF